MRECERTSLDAAFRAFEVAGVAISVVGQWKSRPRLHAYCTVDELRARHHEFRPGRGRERIGERMVDRGRWTVDHG